MEIYLEKENKFIQYKIEGEKILKDILKELNVNIDSVILSKNDEIALEDEIVNNNDKLKILSVVSGG